MVAEEGLPWSAGCCGASRTIVSVRSRCHISRRGDFLTPAGLLAPPGACGEQVPVVGGPGFRAGGHAELAHQAIDIGLDGALGHEEPLADLTVCPVEMQPRDAEVATVVGVASRGYMTATIRTAFGPCGYIQDHRAIEPYLPDVPAPAAQACAGQVADQIANTSRNTRGRSSRSCYPYCMISPNRGNITGFRVQVPLGRSKTP